MIQHLDSALEEAKKIPVPTYYNSHVTLPASDVSDFCTKILNRFSEIPNNPTDILKKQFASDESEGHEQAKELANKLGGLLEGTPLESIKEDLMGSINRTQSRHSNNAFVMEKVEHHPLFKMFVVTNCPSYYLVRKIQDSASLASACASLDNAVVTLSVEDAADFMTEVRLLNLDPISEITNSEEV